MQQVLLLKLEAHDRVVATLARVVQVVLAVNAMSTCGLIHAALMKTGKLYVAESEEAEFMKRCREFALQCASAHPPSSAVATIAVSPPKLLFACRLFCGQALWWPAFPVAQASGGMRHLE